MGQCMQTQVTNSRMHPYLGYLIQVQQKAGKFYQLGFPVTSEEEYISWSKNIRKLKYNLEIKQYLYLPERQKFSQGEGLCHGSGRAQLIFLPFLESLKQTLIKNINNHRYFHQSYLWYLIYVLAKCLKFYQKRQQSLNNIRFDNLLVFADGSIRMIPEEIIPNHELTNTLYAQIQIQADFPIIKQKKSFENLSDVYIVGAICLSVADLLHPVLLFDKNKNKWNILGDQSRKESLKNCEKRYSALLVQTLTELTQKTIQKQIKIESLCKRLQIFQTEILAKKQFGLGLNLGLSSIESIKTSYCMQNKTFISNNSNMLRLSSMGNESTSPTHRSMKNEKVEEIMNKEDDYLNIL